MAVEHDLYSNQVFNGIQDAPFASSKVDHA
jgi:hypothetical protein